MKPGGDNPVYNFTDEKQTKVQTILPTVLSRKIGRFQALSGAEKILFARAWIMLGYVRVVLVANSFKRLTKSLQHHRDIPVCTALQPSQCETARHLAKVVARAARYTPWRSRCLVQVLVLQRLLAEYRVPGQFYLGVSRPTGSGAEKAAMAAHAWLQCGDTIVSGGAGHEQFTVVSTFSWGSEGG